MQIQNEFLIRMNPIDLYLKSGSDQLELGLNRINFKPI